MKERTALIKRQEQFSDSIKNMSNLSDTARVQFASEVSSCQEKIQYIDDSMNNLSQNIFPTS